MTDEREAYLGPRRRASIGLFATAMLLLAFSCGGQQSTAGAIVPLPVPEPQPWDKSGWTITFHDEFDGGSLSTTNWSRRYHWGEAVINGELQAYVDDAFQCSDGVLSILGEKRTGQYAGQTMNYTSGVICSSHYQQYGWFEIRCRVPAGQGYWPAFWLLGDTSIHEIDVLEILGQQPSVLYTTVHWGTDYTTDHFSDGKSITGADFSAGFHVFALEWDATKIVWYVDGTEVFRHTGDGVPKVPLYIIANLAIGGGWPGAPDPSTVFPGTYAIDYIRAYQKTN